jgi:hypothetical protein
MATNESNLAGREKYWDELDDKDKIERMRRIVKAQSREVQELQDTIRKLRNHLHYTGTGKIVVEMDAAGPRGFVGKTTYSGQEYF